MMMASEVGGMAITPLRLVVVNGNENVAKQKVVKHHELLHIATQHLLNGKMSEPLIEGATQVYTRRAFATEFILNRIAGVDRTQNYPSGMMTYLLMERAAGSQIASDAFFNGEVAN